MTRRVVLLAIAAVSLVVVAFLVPLLPLVREVVAARAEAAAAAEAQSLASFVSSGDLAALELGVAQLNVGSPRQTTVFLPDGRRLGAAAERDDAVRLAGTGQAFTAEEADGRAVLVPVLLFDGSRAVVRTFVPQAALEQGVRRAWLALILLGTALLVLAAVVAALLGRSLVRPLRSVAGTADALRGGDRDARAEVSGPADVRGIAEALNRLADRIDELLQAERESVADLSHRLRTPLTALRLDAEALRNPDEAERVLADVDAVQRMVTHLIGAARRPDAAETVPADLTEVARERVHFWSALAEDQGRAVRVALPDGPVPVRVPADRLGAALDALLGNVVAHTEPGVGLTVEVLAAPPTLVVQDDGPGIADLTAVRGRGWSGGASTGLGLDIVRRTAHDAGGRMELANVEPHGLRVTVRFDGAPVRPATGPGAGPVGRAGGGTGAAGR